MDELLALHSQKKIAPHVDRIFAMEDVAEAHHLLETRRTKGKLLLIPFAE